MQYQIISYGPFIGLNTEGMETPEEIKRTSLRGPGRPQKYFIECITPKYKNQADQLIEGIRAEINGKEPLYIWAVIYALRDLGYIIRPGLSAFNREFFPNEDPDFRKNVYWEKVPVDKERTPDKIRNHPEMKAIKNRLILNPR